MAWIAYQRKRPSHGRHCRLAGLSVVHVAQLPVDLLGTDRTVVPNLRGCPQRFPRFGRSGPEHKPSVKADAARWRAAVSKASTLRALASSASRGPIGSADSNPCLDARLIERPWSALVPLPPWTEGDREFPACRLRGLFRTNSHPESVVAPPLQRIDSRVRTGSPEPVSNAKRRGLCCPVSPGPAKTE